MKMITDGSSISYILYMFAILTPVVIYCVCLKELQKQQIIVGEVERKGDKLK